MIDPPFLGIICFTLTKDCIMLCISLAKERSVIKTETRVVR